MRHRGFIRGWLVLAAIITAGLGAHLFNSEQRTWQRMGAASASYCTRQQIDSPVHPDSLKCIERMGANKTIFQHERVTPLVYWSELFGISFALVVASTALFALMLLALKWVMEGFRDVSNGGFEEWWGRTIEGRGTIDAGQIPGNLDLLIVMRRLSTQDVAEFYRSEGIHDHPSVRGLLAGHELRRRESWTARIALMISLLALCLSLMLAIL